MNIREYLNNNPAIITIGAVVVLVICLGAIIYQLKPRRGSTAPRDVYFYDMNTDELFTASASLYPPIQSPTDDENGLSGVRAMVYSCSNCKKKGTHFVGYLERYTPKAKAAMEKAANSEDPMMEDYFEIDEGREIRLPDSQNWINANSEEGMSIYSTISEQCSEGEQLRQCFPR